jgi:hypothetical protein
MALCNIHVCVGGGERLSLSALCPHRGIILTEFPNEIWAPASQTRINSGEGSISNRIWIIDILSAANPSTGRRERSAPKERRRRRLSA